jgi:stage IV sporulation protein FB
MRDLLSWNLSLGRWAGVQIRLHVFFVLFAVFVLHFGAQEKMAGYAAVFVGLLFVSALAHELGHCFAAWKLGGTTDQVLLWPFGGLSHINVSQEPQVELVTTVAGPLVNMSICTLATPLLVFTGANIMELANPFELPGMDGLTAQNVLKMTFWTNSLLTMVNLLPAFPLDGGRLLRALLWQKFGYRSAVQLVVRAAKLSALFLCIGAWWVWTSYPFASLPLALLGIFLYFSAKQEADRLLDHDGGDGVFGYDFSQGYTSLERHYQSRPRDPGPLRKWLETRRAARLERQQKIEEDEERRVDEILMRLHEAGPSGLSDEDRALLDRVSARYRNRQRG